MTRAPEAITCLLCGREDPDVRMDLVEVERPERTVDVQVPATHRADAVLMTVTVPERYYSVPRCRDRAGCKERAMLADATLIDEAPAPPELERDDDPMAYL